MHVEECMVRRIGKDCMMMGKHLAAAVLISNTEPHLVLLLVVLEHTSNRSWLNSSAIIQAQE